MPRRFLVTGAASGIGAATCRLLAGPDAAVAVHTRRNRDGAERTAADVRDRGATAHVLLGDLADPAEPARAVAEAVAALGGLDVVVANAGFADRTPVAELTDAAYLRSHDTIALGFLRMARAARPHLLAGDQPRLIAVSSFVVQVFRTGTPVFPASAAAKAALEALVRVMALEWAPAITVNAVAPGFTRKDAGAHAALDPAAYAATVARIPMGRLGLPEDVAAAIAFLASPAAAYVTGQVVRVDGGLVV